MSFWTAVVVIVAILAGTIISTSKHKAKHNSADNDKTNELEKEIEALKARIVTLEKIVTDPGYDLKKQFKDLEDDRVA
ncbi:MAG: hypothetical protein CBB67_014110 [Alteromonadaceae bacterium TMED7]|jgi:uncharacterized protein YlxW (UPF0749 family)|uniref:Uncharacterized protein n=1 Tax=Alteromonas alba TaxID=2079529 RepID=A0A2S9V989_9ALTE|nr:hypothetical protein [Alteromonas alba]MAJ70921.1 hypothetical protein [Alteromonadaceae bacterium]PRO73036.1 hypothetical protein C6Y40_13630 [Alteromonas alba]RPH17022.1 MAG: hypothetical protein CBB67_014110 [Alteromonadaceae bacterium TMED7]|tara:strand:- start:10792 stop:11025 length:234 start_codon:yes stop_codon:yes gene_type:complete